MCKVGLKLFILLVSCLAIPTITFSESIPMKYQGFWSGKSCDFSIEKYANPPHACSLAHLSMLSKKQLVSNENEPTIYHSVNR